MLHNSLPSVLFEKDSGTPSGGAGKVTIKVGDEEKTLSAEEVANLHSQVQSLTSKAQVAERFLKAAERYDVDPETLYSNYEQGIRIAQSLIDQGVINERGELVKPAKEPPKGDDDPPPVARNNMDLNSKRVEEIVSKALQSAGIDSLAQTVRQLQDGQTGLFRLQLENQIQANFPGLSKDDISRAIATASRDRSKDIMTVAKEFADSKAAQEGEFKEKHKKELEEQFGINFEELEEKKKAKTVTEDGTPVSLAGKKFMFGDRAKRAKVNDDTVVEPHEAAAEYLKQLEEK